MLPRVSYVIIFAALVAPNSWAQEATKVCSDGRMIKIASRWDQLGLTMAASDVAAQPIRYSISSLRDVHGAWIEVWDRPKRLSRQAVPVRCWRNSERTASFDLRSRRAFDLHRLLRPRNSHEWLVCFRSDGGKAAG
jgi:hypothetical protein